MRLVTALALYCGAIGSAWASSATTNVCHTTGNGGVVDLTVASSAQWAHLDHDDYLPIAFYPDADGDGFGDPFADPVLACLPPEGTVANADDCDDNDATLVADPSDPTLCAREYQGWLVTPGRVEPGAEAGTLVGGFTFTRLPGDPAETRGGGGCLLADLFSGDDRWADFSCSTGADCNIADRSHPDFYEGAFRYCASPDGSGEPNRCWTTPTNNCSRAGYREPGEYAANVDYPVAPTADKPATPETPTTPRMPPVYGHAGQDGQSEVRWMVIACMAASGVPIGCGTGQRIYAFGPVYTWTPE